MLSGNVVSVADPEAVVPFGNARGYMKSLCEKRGWASDGAIHTEDREPEDDPLANHNCPLAPDLIRRKGINMIEKEPHLKKLPSQEMRQKVLERFGPSK